LRVAVGGTFAAWEDALSEGSEIAFIPPVSGG
jgi:molybdopterin synthase sulfur carrier subunit